MSADSEGHDFHGHPAPAVQLCGHLQPLQAAAMCVDEGQPPGCCGGRNRRHLGTGARWVLEAVLAGEEGQPGLGEQLSYSGATTQVQISEAGW